MIHTVLVHLIDEKGGRIMLAKKKRGIGKGYYNGVGGKIETGETPKEAAIREAKEELHIEIEKADLIDIGTLGFHFKGHSTWNISNEVFFTHRWKGEPKESEEMAKPEWFKLDNLPYEQMWHDDLLWMPQALAGFTVDGDFYFDEEGKNIITYSMKGGVLKEKKSRTHTREDIPEPRVIIPEDPNNIKFDEPKKEEKPAITTATNSKEDDPRAAPPELQGEEMPNLRQL